MFKHILAPDITFALITLIFGLLFRGLFLEYTDLMDPTEARYASVAQEMVLSHNWLTPKLPMPEGVVPYLSKPPLHFWLTALSYTLFGVDEWTSRLPSFLSALAILAVVSLFSLRYFGKREAIAASLITFSSGMFFFLSGASVTDMTLTALISIAILLLYRFVSEPEASPYYILSSAGVSGLAFLCKGPIGVILVILPLIIWSVICRNFLWIKRIHWVRASIVFLLVVSPWFILCEIKNPGFLKYFFWNENIGRYLLNDYGDRYGAGHVQTYGMSWIMLLAAFCPWTIFLAWSLYKQGRKGILESIKADKNLLFVASWALSTPLFFTFVRNLHALYILPAIPGLSILTAVFLMQLFKSRKSDVQKIHSISVQAAFMCLLLVLLVVGIVLKLSLEGTVVYLGVAILGILVVTYARRFLTDLGTINLVSCFCIITYFTIIVAFTPYIDKRRSAEVVLKDLVNDYNTPFDHVHRVGVLTRNSFSHYWAAKAWQSELGEAVVVKYVGPPAIKSSDVGYFLVKTKDPSQVLSEITDNFHFVRQTGDWLLYKRKSA